MGSGLTAGEALTRIKSVGIVGSGQMGSGIAQVFAGLGIPTLMLDADASQVTRAVRSINERLQKSVEKGKISEDLARKTRENLRPISTTTELGGVDLVVEDDRDQRETEH